MRAQRASRYGRAPRRGWPLLLGLLGAGVALALVQTDGAAQRSNPQFIATFEYGDTIRQRLARLDEPEKAQQWDQWLTICQRLIDDSPDGVVPRDSEVMVGLRYMLHQKLATLPAVVRDQYRTRFDKDASDLYDDAARDDDALQMAQVVSRYRHTLHSDRALLWLANRALDRGNATIAHAAYARLATAPNALASTLLRYAVASQAIGRIEEARQTLQRVAQHAPGEELALGGQRLTAARAAAQLLDELPAPAAATSPDWTRFSGADGTRRMIAETPRGLAPMWSYVYPTESTEATRSFVAQVAVSSGYAGSNSRFGFLGFPVAAGDRVVAQGPLTVSLLDAATGKPRWEQADFNLPTSALPPPPTGRGGMGLPYYQSSSTLQAAPTLSGRWVVTRVPIVMPGSRGRNDDYRRLPLHHALLVADAASGDVLWKKLWDQDPPGSFYNVPTVVDNTIVSGVGSVLAAITEYRVVALEAGTGEPLWATYLGGGSDPLITTDGSPAVVRDGLVWIETALYTLSAVDVVTGEIRFIYRYEPEAGLQLQQSRRYRPVPNEPISLLPAGDGPVVFVPRWGRDVAALDPIEGRLLWTAPKGYGVSLFGVDDRHAYVGGSTLQAFDLASGARVWIWEPDVARSNVGYAALTDGRVFVVVENALEIRSAADGRALQRIDLAATLGDTPGYTSLIVRPESVLISTRGGLFAYRIER